MSVMAFYTHTYECVLTYRSFHYLQKFSLYARVSKTINFQISEKNYFIDQISPFTVSFSQFQYSVALFHGQGD
jgi:hypothetical protein